MLADNNPTGTRSPEPSIAFDADSIVPAERFHQLHRSGMHKAPVSQQNHLCLGGQILSRLADQLLIGIK